MTGWQALDIHVFFFFQAEDGIRDVAVTGVQTCALPILFFAGCDVEINPEAVGAHLKLFVSAETRSIRLQKHFGHIAIPKLLPSPVPLGIWENRDGPVFRPKPQKQRSEEHTSELQSRLPPVCRL